MEATRKNVGSFLAFNKDFFDKHQRALLWLLNAPIVKIWFRWILRIRAEDLPRSERISEISPNSFTFGEKYDFEKQEITKTTDFRTHPKYGKRIYYAFRPLWWVMHFWDWAFADRFSPQLSFGFSTLTAYPDASTGATTCDATLENNSAGAGIDFSDIVSGASGTKTADPTSALVYIMGISSGSTLNKFSHLQRFMATFDTSAITSGATISAATLSMRAAAAGSKDDSFTVPAAPDLNVYGATPASNNSIVSADYTQFGSTAYSSSPLTYAGYTNGVYNDLAFNATGIAAISKTGISKFGLKNANYDNANSAPVWSASKSTGFVAYSADDSGTTRDPKLVVTYTTSTDYTKSLSEAIAVNSPNSTKTTGKSLRQTITIATVFAKVLSSFRTFTERIVASGAFQSSRIYFKSLLESMYARDYKSASNTPMEQGITPFLWIKADSLTLNDGAEVSTWNDLSGNGNNFGSSPSYKPLLKHNILNGHSGVLFDGINDFVSLSGSAALTKFLSDGSPFMIFLVASHTIANGSNGVILDTSGGSSGTIGFRMRYQDVPADNEVIDFTIFRAVGGTLAVTFKTPNASFPASTPFIAMLGLNSSTGGTTDKNNVQLASGAVLNSFNTGTPYGGFIVGNNTGLNSPFKGYIHEIIIYQTTPTSAIKNSISAYLSARYQIAIGSSPAISADVILQLISFVTSRVLREVVNLVDLFSRAATRFRTFIEAVVVNAAKTALVGRALVESVKINTQAYFGSFRLFYETISVSASFLATSSRNLLETISVKTSDIVRTVGKNLVETLNIGHTRLALYLNGIRVGLWTKVERIPSVWASIVRKVTSWTKIDRIE